MPPQQLPHEGPESDGDSAPAAASEANPLGAAESGLAAAKQQRRYKDILRTLGFTAGPMSEVEQQPTADLCAGTDVPPCSDELRRGGGIPRPIYLAAMYVYPIKSCAGTTFQSLFTCTCRTDTCGSDADRCTSRVT